MRENEVSRPGFVGQIGAKRIWLDVERSKANAADRDAVAGVQLLGGVGGVNGDAMIAAALHDAGDGSHFFD